jgi:hypothetical protein
VLQADASAKPEVLSLLSSWKLVLAVMQSAGEHDAGTILITPIQRPLQQGISSMPGVLVKRS